MLRNIKIALILITSCVLSQAQDFKVPPCSILSSTITCGANSLNAGSVSTLSVITANGISGVVANPTTTPAITLTLGDIVPNTISANTISSGNVSYFHGSTVTLSNYSAANVGTLTNAPGVGNPTKWIGINDNGTIRKIPAW